MAESNISFMNESQIKSFFKQTILNGTFCRVLESRPIKKSQYLQKIARESSNELESMIKILETTTDSASIKWKFLVKNI